MCDVLAPTRPPLHRDGVVRHDTSQGIAMTPPTAKEMEQRLIALDEAMQVRLSNTPHEALSHPERGFRCVWELEAEVNNGGFSQYFLNSSGRHAAEAPDALRAIGAVHAAGIAEAALGVMGHGAPWTDDDKRQDAVVNIGDVAEEALGALDTKFYAYPDDLSTMLYA